MSGISAWFFRFRVWIGVLAGIAGLIYLLQDSIKDYFTRQTADVASRSLDQETMQRKTKQFIDSILSDPATRDRASLFVRTLLTDEQTRQTLRELLRTILTDPELKSTVQTVFNNVVRDALANEENRRNLTLLFKDLIQDPQTQQASSALVQRLAADPAVKAYVDLTPANSFSLRGRFDWLTVCFIDCTQIPGDLAVSNGAGASHSQRSVCNRASERAGSASRPGCAAPDRTTGQGSVADQLSLFSLVHSH